MKLVIQRVKSASVTVDDVLISQISNGLLILLGVTESDTKDEALYLAEKCAGLRIFSDSEDKMNLSVVDISGEILVVPNFTLYGDCKKGKRPNFMNAAAPTHAEQLYEYFISLLKDKEIPTGTGSFGADMRVAMIGDGPVTIIMDTAEMRAK